MDRCDTFFGGFRIFVVVSPDRNVMRWYNFEKDPPPKDGQPVLVSVNGIYHVTVYDISGQYFVGRTNPEIIFRKEDSPIYWLPLEEIAG